MSTKDNIEYIKGELSNQEKFLKGFFHLEQFYRKRKKQFMVAFVIIVIGFIGLFVNSYINEQNNLKANIAFNKLNTDTYSKENEDILKKYNPKLYSVYKFKKMINSNDIQDEKISLQDLPLLQDLLDYQQAVIKKDIPLLSSYSLKQKSTLKDLAILSEALLLIEQDKIKEAKDKLVFISGTSQLQSFATLIKHYLITR